MALFKWAFCDFHAGNWHPLTWISHALDFAVWGLNPPGHHLTNNILHAVNTFLVMFLIIKLLETARERTVQAGLSEFLTERTILIAAGVTGLLFGLHPLHVESVAWVSERKDLLCALFFLLSIIQYTNYVRSEGNERASKKPSLYLSNKNYLLALAFFILALLSKPMAVTLPFVLLIVDWYPFNRTTSLGTFRSVLIEKLPFVALSIASSIVTVFAQHDSMTSAAVIPLSTRLLVAVRSLIYYLWNMIWPLNLVPLYPYPKVVSLLSFEYLSAIALVIGITVGCIVIVKKQRVWMTAWGYYVVTLIPVIGIVQVGYQSMADRYTYLPSLGPFLIMGLGAAWILTKMTPVKKGRVIAQFFGTALALFIFVPMTSVTIKQIGIWRNSFVFWDYVIKNETTRNPIPYFNLGVTYEIYGQLDQAMKQYQIAIDLDPYYVQAHNNLGVFYIKQGSLDQAIEQYEIAIRVDPSFAQAHNNLGEAYQTKGFLDRAIEQYMIALGLNSDDYNAHNDLGAAYLEKGLKDQAIEQFMIAVKLKPESPKAHNTLGIVYDRFGLSTQAFEQFQTAVKLDPTNVILRKNLADVYKKIRSR